MLNQYPFWIGLNDREEEGNYVWSSGEKYPYTNWHLPSEPNGHNHSADCADMLVVNIRHAFVKIPHTHSLNSAYAFDKCHIVAYASVK